MSEEKKNESLKESLIKTLVITIVIVVIIAVAVLVLRSCVYSTTSQSPSNLGANDNRTTYRDATTSDINGHWNETLTGQDFVFIPKHDIVNLQLTVYINNRDGEVIKKVVKDIGDVIQGRQYTVTLTISDIGLGNIFSANSTTLKVTGGRVTLI